jgi:hypothetical protein
LKAPCFNPCTFKVKNRFRIFAFSNCATCTATNGWLQDKCKAQEAELASMRDRLAAAEAAASVVRTGPVLPPSP